MVDHGVVCSMSRSGNVWDNAAMESFFSSLKTERTARKMYRSRNEAKADVFDYIERFYNPKRRHSTIGYMSPMEFERQAGLAYAGVNRTGCSSPYASDKDEEAAMFCRFMQHLHSGSPLLLCMFSVAPARRCLSGCVCLVVQRFDRIVKTTGPIHSSHQEFDVPMSSMRCQRLIPSGVRLA
jgi:hypothetical protein